MRFHVLTLFPQMIEQGLSESITGRALKQITHMVAVQGCLCRQSRCIRL